MIPAEFYESVASEEYEDDFDSFEEDKEGGNGVEVNVGDGGWAKGEAWRGAKDGWSEATARTSHFLPA